ncbi:FG-GAP-like repeat-containing protein [Tautonia marina]|uniref:FG-GAP-like repeat-containing protein n=1 Tax=Tautonia marina TaxID=2653855 RepID=UPI0012613A62|nr:FG-GAP-like repeat-containing protein [Tautonia marina]
MILSRFLIEGSRIPRAGSNRWRNIRSHKNWPRLLPLEDRTLLNASLDPTFGLGGKATVPYELARGEANDVAIQADGKIVAVGNFAYASTGDFGVARYNPDGSLDPTFSGDGVASIGFNLGGNDYDQATGVVIQPDGKIVVAGYAEAGGGGNFEFAITRLNPNGSLDTSFDGDGRRTFGYDLGGDNADYAHAVALQADGKIVLVGSADFGGGDTDFAIARLNPSGSLDSTFSGDGKQTAFFDLGGSRADAAWDVVIQADNRIVIVGTAERDTGSDFAIARLNPDGMFDSTFDGDGRQTVAFDQGSNNADEAFGVALQADGKIVVVGSVDRALPGDRDFGVARLNPNGSLDSSFSGDGKAMVAFDIGGAMSDQGSDLAIQSDGKLVLVGTAVLPGGNSDFAVARLNVNGTLDTSFSGDGKVTIPFDQGMLDIDFAQAVAVQPDGKIVVVGGAERPEGPPHWSFGLARLNSNGTLDPMFEPGGKVATPFGLAVGAAMDMVVQPDGKILIVGSILVGDNYDFVVARTLADGRLDTTFGGGSGKVTIPFDYGGNNHDFALAIALAPDGKIVVAGAVAGQYGGSDTDFGVARLNPDGTIDTTFDALGPFPGRRWVAFDLGQDNADVAYDVVVQPDGKIVVVGSAQVLGGGTDFAIARINPDGKLDGSFSFPVGAGRITISFDPPGVYNKDEATGVALQEDGKIVVVGYASPFTGPDFAIARINPDGTLDTSFSGDGKQVVPFDVSGPGNDQAEDVVVQPDGKIVVVGVVGTGTAGADDFGIVRLNSNGTLDPNFSGDGKQTVAFNLGGGNVDKARAVAMQGDRILVAGFAESDFAGQYDFEFAIARLRPDGALDPTFNGTGKQTIAINLGDTMIDDATALAVLPGNKVVLAGWASTDTPTGGVMPVLARLNTSTPFAVEGDYDGDGRTDLALYRYDAATSSGRFLIRRSSTGTDIAVPISGVGSQVVPISGDFDGDGKTDVAVVDPLAHGPGGLVPDRTRWIILLSGSGNFRREVEFGAAGVLDRPAPADFDGDGRTDIATFRANSDLTPGAAEWFILPSEPNPGYTTKVGAFAVAFGAPGGADLPAPADYDGDGRADIVSFRPIPTPQDIVYGVPSWAAQWLILPSGPNDATFSGRVGAFPVRFGAANNLDQPAVADYNGDGRADITAFRQYSDKIAGVAQWFIYPSLALSPEYANAYDVVFGVAGEIAAVGDYTRDGRPDLALFNQSTGVWTRRSGTLGTVLPSVSFGPTGPGVVPVLAPLYFRLKATGNLPTSAASTATGLSAGLASVVDRAIDDWVRPVLLDG